MEVGGFLPNNMEKNVKSLLFEIHLPRLLPRPCGEQVLLSLSKQQQVAFSFLCGEALMAVQTR